MVKRIVMLVASATYLCAREMGRAIRRIFGRSEAPRATVVLTYHSVGVNELSRFEWQMDQVARRFVPVFADESASGRCRAVAVTFDDAFQSVFDRVLPVLARQAIPVTIFVPTGYLGLDPGWMSSRSLGTVVSATTLAHLDRARVRLGSHTVSHPLLEQLEDVRVDEELRASKAMLEDLTGERIAMLALPYGSWTPAVIVAAQRAGYRHVFANVPIRRVSESEPLVGRVDVSPRDWPVEFVLKIHGAYGWMSVAVPTKRAVLNVFNRMVRA